MRTFATHLRNKSTGEMAEWSIAAVLKTVVLRGTRGSNPCLSAGKNYKTKKIPCKLILYGGFFVFGAWQISISLATDFTFIKIILFSDKFPEVSLTYYLFH